MRYSAVAALCAAPLALAGMLQAEVIPRGLQAREKQGGGGGKEAVQLVSTTTIIIVWVNPGGGAPTSQVHPTQAQPAATHTVRHFSQAIS